MKKPRPSKAPTLMKELTPVIQPSNFDERVVPTTSVDPPYSSGSSGPSDFPIGPEVLTAIFEVPGNGFKSMEAITEIVRAAIFVISTDIETDLVTSRFERRSLF